MPSRSSWPLPLNIAAGISLESREALTGHRTQQSRFSSINHQPSPAPVMADWNLAQQHEQHRQQHQQQIPPLPAYLPNQSLIDTQYGNFAANYNHPQLEYMDLASNQAPFESNLTMDAPYAAVTSNIHSPALWANWEDFQNQLAFNGNDSLPSVGRQSLGSNSPTGTYLEIISLPSSGSDNGWATVESYPNIDTFHHNTAVFNPGQTLHLRTNSESSTSDGTAQNLESCIGSSFEDISSYSYSPYSPASDYCTKFESHNCVYSDSHSNPSHSPPQPIVTNEMPIATPSKSTASSLGRTSPTIPSSTLIARRNSAPRKSPSSKTPKPILRRASTGKKDTEKRVGRRRGPLLPEQRKQASEIRKLRACLRCKFLKKTCDKGEPCAGCKPSHARLWQVPCTRIDIKDIAYFMKDWRADHERLVGSGVSVYNIKGFAQTEQLIWITHGYGFAIPIMAREVFVSDDSCFTVEWIESFHKQNLEFGARTERMSAGSEGISTEALSEYLDKHLDGPFEKFLDEYFEGTPFITDVLKTAHRYYVKEQVPVIRKALKLVLAYNLTLHVTMVEQRGINHHMEGLIDNVYSKFNGKIIAPVMINFQVKCALADMWRDLQKEILVELSSLYSSVYSGDRLKNWPTIFMLASILLAVWEEMQFDSHFRVPDQTAAEKFCNDMETTPVGVIIGLFHAISQKLPSFTEWDTRRHGQLLNNNLAVCEAMTEMKDHVTKHETYLRTRPEARFNSCDFDSLSNKFLSKLVIRAS